MRTTQRVAMLALEVTILLVVPFLAHGAEAEGEFVLNGDAQRGVQVFKTFCLVCHGEGGKGDGPAAVALDPKPADYTDADRMSKLTDKDLYEVVREGGAAVGKSPFMASWKAALSDQQIRDVVAYVRTFAAKTE